MISYETYKFLHLFFIITFFASLGLAASASPLIANKTGKIITGVISFLIFVAGMGLIARLGFKHNQGFPLWIYLKMLNWLVINILFVFLFKLENLKHKAIISLLILLIGATTTWVVINKPI